MNTIKYILLVFITLFFIDGAVSQNTCDLGHLIPVKKAEGEVNDTLPDLDPPAPYDTHENHTDNRMLYFIHGLNGTEASWSQADVASTDGVPAFQFPARKVLTERVEYDSDQTLAGARNSVISGIGDPPFSSLPEGYNKYDGIAIGHSQGGIVGRSMDKFFSHRNLSGDLVNASQRKFGGLVTVATPNQGAQILNNEDFMRGLVYDLADNLTAGPIREFTSSSNYFVRLMASLVNLSEMRDSLVNFIGNDIGSFLIAEGMPKITEEYTVPGSSGKGLSSKIPDLNAYDPVVLEIDNNERPADLVAFYAVADLKQTYNNVSIEEIVGFQSGQYVSEPIRQTTVIDEILVPISWGTLHFQLNDPNHHEIFGADDEDYLTAYKAHKTKNFYDSKFFQNSIDVEYYRHVERGARRSLNLFGYFWARDQRRSAQNRRDDWERGSVMLSKFDELYRIAIGARYSEWVTHSQPLLIDFCDCEDLVNGNLIPMDCVLLIDHHDVNTLDCNDYPDPPEELVFEVLYWRNKDSDGVVLAESQMDIPQHTWEPQRLDNVTHMQVRNSIRTEEMLQTVFEGGVGNFFYTEKK